MNVRRSAGKISKFCLLLLMDVTLTAHTGPSQVNVNMLIYILGQMTDGDVSRRRSLMQSVMVKLHYYLKFLMLLHLYFSSLALRGLKP